MQRTALYIRVSTDEQARHGLSLDAQLQDLKKYAKNHNYEIVGIYADEGASARKKPFSRKEFCRMIDDIKQGSIDIILFIKIDRWFRSVADYYKAQEILDTYHVVWETTQEQYNTTTTNGRLMLNIKLAIAQNESDTTSDRIKFVFSQKIARGEVVSGKIPLGYQIVDKHIVKSDKAYIIEELYAHYLQHQSLGDALRWLQQSHGIHMHPESIKRLLTTELFTGRRQGNDHFAERIIDDDTFYAVQKIIQSNGNIKTTPSGRIYLFSGLLHCPECGRRLAVVSSQLNKNGSRYIYYRCPQHYQSRRCPNKKIYPEKRIETALLATIDDQLDNLFIAAKQRPLKQRTVHSNEGEIRKKLDRLKELYVNSLIDMDTYKKDYDKLMKSLIPIMPIKRKVNPILKRMHTEGAIEVYENLSAKQCSTFWHQVADRIEFRNGEPLIFFK